MIDKELISKLLFTNLKFHNSIIYPSIDSFLVNNHLSIAVFQNH